MTEPSWNRCHHPNQKKLEKFKYRMVVSYTMIGLSRRTTLESNWWQSRQSWKILTVVARQTIFTSSCTYLHIPGICTLGERPFGVRLKFWNSRRIEGAPSPALAVASPHLRIANSQCLTSTNIRVVIKIIIIIIIKKTKEAVPCTPSWAKRFLGSLSPGQGCLCNQFRLRVWHPPFNLRTRPETDSTGKILQ